MQMHIGSLFQNEVVVFPKHAVRSIFQEVVCFCDIPVMRSIVGTVLSVTFCDKILGR